MPRTGSHDAANFDSGEPSLDSWLREHAARTARRHLSATHVWASQGGGIVAYATLTSSVVARTDLPKSIGHGFPDTIPAVLLGRLALDKALQGKGLGGRLLAEALTIAANSARDVAAAFVVVDALHEKRWSSTSITDSRACLARSGWYSRSRQ